MNNLLCELFFAIIKKPPKTCKSQKTHITCEASFGNSSFCKLQFTGYDLVTDATGIRRVDTF